MKTVKVGKARIGDTQPTYIIAEIGINHNGDTELAKEMISAAWEAGADAVKIQTFITRKFLHPSHPGFQYDIDAQIPHEKEQEIWDYAKTRKINLFSTPEELKSLKFIKGQNPKLIKISAMDFNFQLLIQEAAKLHKPLILSSGMSTLEEVLTTVRWVKEIGNDDYIVLHCVSCYPTHPEACNLRAIQTMKQILDCPVGFSDHTIGTHIPLAAVALGANVIEKHFTIDKKLQGPDQKCSMEPSELRSLRNQIKDLEKAMGNGKKEVANEEELPRQFKRRGIYAKNDLHKGKILSSNDVGFLAPSKGNSVVTNWPEIKGRTLKRAVKKDSPIFLEDVY